ncbi:hypothetical protein GCM10022408_22090 [Hymenobacter fastidiosus]|uniref:DUF4276 family protein n=1 Tax=Hymenobacter fastidiosus TaxID=486264 RepID=A0ABP7SBQ2_9BACT
MLIGVVAEAPSDTLAIIGLLKPLLPADIDFTELVKNIRGSDLDSLKTQTLIRLEVQAEQPDLVILCRDLDGLSWERKKQLNARKFFRKTNRIIKVNNRERGVNLICIFELETLILFDIDCFNNEYEVSLDLLDSPESCVDPKGILKEATSKKAKRFTESHNGELIPKLRKDLIIRAEFYKKFLYYLEARLLEKGLVVNLIDQHN